MRANKLVLVLPILFLSLWAGAQTDTRNLQTVGKPINTVEHTEFAPTVSADGNFMVFETNKNGRWELYMSTKKAGVWSEPKPLTSVNKHIEPGDFLGGPCLSYDGTLLLFTSNMKGSVGGVDCWYSKNEGGYWSDPINFGRQINSSGYDGFPAISPDGKKLYFMREGDKNSPSGQRCCVLYEATKRGNYFINPKPMPYPINTGCEAYPRIMADGVTLIFSSYRPGGKGGYDLYVSRQQAGKWTTPTNMAFANSGVDDELISVPASGDILYLSSTQTNKKDDIFFLKIPKEFQPQELVSVAGFVKDEETQKPIAAIVQINDMKTKQKVAEIENDSVSGRYQVYLQRGRKYDVSITAKQHSFQSEVIDLQAVGQYQTFRKDVRLEKLKPQMSFPLNNIFFEFDAATLNPDSEFELDRVVDMFKSNLGMVVEIAAHTDDVGSDDYNNKLSQARADAVVNYLISKGVSASQLKPKGYGETVPAFPNDSDINRAKNRRVEFKVLTM
jgi:OOP family OmpA-OmpF porin